MTQQCIVYAVFSRQLKNLKHQLHFRSRIHTQRIRILGSCRVALAPSVISWSHELTIQDLNPHTTVL
jgi:hypothetical protein